MSEEKKEEGSINFIGAENKFFEKEKDPIFKKMKSKKTRKILKKI